MRHFQPRRREYEVDGHHVTVLDGAGGSLMSSTNIEGTHYLLSWREGRPHLQNVIRLREDVGEFQPMAGMSAEIISVLTRGRDLDAKERAG